MITYLDPFLCFYICGFVDGEGCFSVSFQFKKKLQIGIETTVSFSVAQKISSANYHVLDTIRQTMGHGAIRSDGTGCYKYETRSLPNICKTVIPFFQTYPLKTDKKVSFEIFSNICSRMQKKEHLNTKGLLQIIELSRKLNPSGSRRIQLDKLILFLKN